MSQDDIQAIKDRLNIVDVVGQYVQLKRAGRTYTARCPFHKERTPSFHVSPERGTYMCFGCGEKGDIFSFVERLEGIDFKTALQQLAQKAGVTLHREFTTKGENTQKDERLKEVCEAATGFFEAQLKLREDVEEYLRGRSVEDHTRTKWRIGYAPAQWHATSEYLLQLGFSKEEVVEAGLAAVSQKRPNEIYDRFRGRIMFPISDNGHVIAFSGRFFEKVEGSREEGEPAKYVNSPETSLFKKSRALYGFDTAKQAIRKADCILLVEGQFDLILSHQCGLPFTVALSGTALTPEHLSQLGRVSKRLVLALDADAAGIRSGLKSAHMAIAAGFDVKIPQFPQGKDPADVARENPEQLKTAIRESKTAVEFFLDVLRPMAKDERLYKRLVETQVLPVIAVMGSSIEQEHFIHLVAHRLGVSEQAVRTEVVKRAKASVPESIDEVIPQGVSHAPLQSWEKKVAMILSYFPENSAQRTALKELVGLDRLTALQGHIAGEEEMWRFRFEQELHGSVDEQAIAGDMLQDIGRVIEKERLKMKFL